MNLIPENCEIKLGKVVYKEPSSLGPRVQPYWQLIYVEEGVLEMEVEGVGILQVEENQAVLSLPGNRETFRFAARGVTRHGWVEVRMPSDVEVDRSNPHAVLSFPEVLWGMVEVLGRCVDGRGWVVTPLGRDVAEALFAACLEPGRIRGPLRRPIHPAVGVARRLMRDSYTQPLRLADLASAAGVTPAHLIRLFKRETGRTPQRELLRIRLQRAEALLVETGWTIAEIAHHCGFADPPHFSRRFTAEYGISPGRHRSLRWAGMITQGESENPPPA